MKEQGRDCPAHRCGAGSASAAAAAAHTDGAGRSTAAAAIARPSTAKCGKTCTIGAGRTDHGRSSSLGVAAAALGAVLRDALEQDVTRSRSSRSSQGDTQLPNVAEAIKAAKTSRSDKRVLGGRRPGGQPGGSGLVRVVSSGGGLAVHLRLGDAHVAHRRHAEELLLPRRAERRRPGPDCRQRTSSTSCTRTTSYIIDDQEAYSQGLADEVERRPEGERVSTSSATRSARQASDFSSQIAKISSRCAVVYIPWQLSAQAQAFGQQLQGGRQEREALRLGRSLRSVDLQDRRFVRLVLPGSGPRRRRRRTALHEGTRR